MYLYHPYLPLRTNYLEHIAAWGITDLHLPSYCVCIAMYFLYLRIFVYLRICMHLYYLSGLIILNTLPLEVSQTHICPVIACICHPGISSYLRDVIWCYPSLHPDTTLIPSYPPKPHLTITSYNLQPLRIKHLSIIAYMSDTSLLERQTQVFYNFFEIY